MLGNEKIDQVCSFTYVGSIISKDGGCTEDAKSRIAKVRGVFSGSSMLVKYVGGQVC